MAIPAFPKYKSEDGINWCSWAVDIHRSFRDGSITKRITRLFGSPWPSEQVQLPEKGTVSQVKIEFSDSESVILRVTVQGIHSIDAYAAYYGRKPKSSDYTVVGTAEVLSVSYATPA